LGGGEIVVGVTSRGLLESVSRFQIQDFPLGKLQDIPQDPLGVLAQERRVPPKPGAHFGKTLPVVGYPCGPISGWSRITRRACGSAGGLHTPGTISAPPGAHPVGLEMAHQVERFEPAGPLPDEPVELVLIGLPRREGGKPRVAAPRRVSRASQNPFHSPSFSTARAIQFSFPRQGYTP